MFVALAASLLVPPARAACPVPYTPTQVAEDLREVQLGLRSMDDALFDGAGKRLELGLPCLDAPLPPAAYAAVYRYVGAWHWIIPGNTTMARRWFRASLELDPDYAWDIEELDPQNAMRQAWEVEGGHALSPIVIVAGKVLAGTYLLDGRPIAVPGATADRPHVLQRIDGTPPSTWIIDGAGFPAEALADAPVAAAEEVRGRRGKPVPTATEAPTATGFDVIRLERERPPAKTPLLLAGGVGMLAAGGVYALAFLSREEFNAADTTEEVRNLQARTNMLVLASGGTALLGLGVGGWGALLDGGAALGFRARF